MEFLRFTYTDNRGYRVPSNEEIYPLVTISKYLIAQGFVFCRAFTADGISEISHTGDAPYHVTYTSLDDFANRFVDDFHLAEKHQSEKSGGWISSLNYGHVDVCLKKDDLLFRAFVHNGVVMEWYGYMEQDSVLINQTDAVMQGILVNLRHTGRTLHQESKNLPNYWG